MGSVTSGENHPMLWLVWAVPYQPNTGPTQNAYKGPPNCDLKQNQSYRSVIKTFFPKEQTWGRSKHVRRDKRFLSFWKKVHIHIAQSFIYYLQKHLFSLLRHDSESVYGVISEP